MLLPAEMALERVQTLVSDALEEEGVGFHVTSACGAVTIPDEADTVQEALRLADRRMYATKFSSRPSIDHPASDVLVRMLDERHPGLGDHVEEVAELAVACARTLGLDHQDVVDVERGSKLHDIGKLAIPESIVNKPGPLTDDEWDFMRRHPVIGERVLGAAPSLRRVAALVRASHERWDGAGYPDHLAGTDIPLGARIVAVADAFSAMTEERPYAAARTVENTLAELRACSGTQFDPAVVAAFIAAHRPVSAPLLAAA